MRAVDLIVKKRDGRELTSEEIAFFIEGYNSGSIPDYQAAAWAMAIVLRGMSAAETTALTLAMASSGQMLDLKDVAQRVVDKHSTGGVGDKTTLVVGPLVAACGLPVGKMSGRGLGFSGGTIDKLESIPGFRVDLTLEEFKTQLHRIGLVVAGQTADLAPADGKLYALRDVTGTVESLPLIASSIMSKKIAGGADAIVLDVKAGNGAFMKTPDEALLLAKTMIEIGKSAGKEVIAVISSMEQPLGYAVGNALEVQEAILSLQSQGPPDFLEHCLTVAGYMLLLGRKVSGVEDARRMLEQVLDQGKAFEKFREFIAAQGGNLDVVDHPRKFPQAPFVETLTTPLAGYIAEVKALDLGWAAVRLGAGRARKADPINHAVGFIVHVKVGDSIAAGQPLVTIHAADQLRLEEARETCSAAIRFSQAPVPPLLPILQTVTG
ncbi:MAG: thymidine phosphorylase [Chloroflexi bacterium]|nr:thymidine phosphorylase [Chloroflexota bacterium]